MVEIFRALTGAILGIGTTTDVGLALLINGRSWAVTATCVLIVGASILQNQSKIRAETQLLDKLEKRPWGGCSVNLTEIALRQWLDDGCLPKRLDNDKITLLGSQGQSF